MKKNSSATFLVILAILAVLVTVLTSCTKDAEKNEADLIAEYLMKYNLDGLVMQTPSGLYYIFEERGNNVKPKPENSVTVNYTGKFLDGRVFDTNEGRAPVTFQLNGVIPGWTEGLQLIGEGGKIKLIVPSKLGYGAAGKGSIPPFTPLAFDIQLLDVN